VIAKGERKEEEKRDDQNSMWDDRIAVPALLLDSGMRMNQNKSNLAGRGRTEWFARQKCCTVASWYPL
jgi:hypothetical protein